MLPHHERGQKLSCGLATYGRACEPSKSEVDYSRGHAGALCGKALDDDKAYCRYFIPPLSPASNLGQCEKVASPINKVYLPVVCAGARQVSCNLICAYTNQLWCLLRDTQPRRAHPLNKQLRPALHLHCS
jgi:hypothetical protein